MWVDRGCRAELLVMIAMASTTHVFLVLFGIILSAFADISSLNTILFNGNYELIDLSHPYDNNTVYWPGNREFAFTKKTEEFTGHDRDDRSWYAANEFATAEHGGTHLDAPYHFYMQGKHVGEIGLEKLIVPLIIVDVSSIVNGNPNFVLQKQHMDHLINDNMGKPCVIIFKFGWSQYYNDIRQYLGKDPVKQALNFPGLSAEVAEWVTSYKNIVGIGVDTASVDPGSSKDFPVHKILARAGRYNMENVNLRQRIPESGCTALVMPMKIAEGTGAPLRLVAICPKQLPDKF